jgi:hypothetical protein
MGLASFGFGFSSAVTSRQLQWQQSTCVKPVRGQQQSGQMRLTHHATGFLPVNEVHVHGCLAVNDLADLSVGKTNITE